ncbi:MAG: class I SAM-dependent methyltransferase [Acidimicrobiia bacterium]
MLTVRYDRLGVGPGDIVLDLGCGAGRHAFEAQRRGARVVALDRSAAELAEVAAVMAVVLEEEAGPRGPVGAGAGVNGDAARLPFPDGAFDRVIAAEVLEHIPDDGAAVAELARVLRPGGTMAVTVPAWLSETGCWALSPRYHAPYVAGGHVRIYTEPALRAKLRAAGLQPGASHHAHALHTPYWWLRCTVGVERQGHPLVRAYHQLLVWGITGTEPVATVSRVIETLANPVLGKSLVVYSDKPC